MEAVGIRVLGSKVFIGFWAFPGLWEIWQEEGCCKGSYIEVIPPPPTKKRQQKGLGEESVDPCI